MDNEKRLKQIEIDLHYLRKEEEEREKSDPNKGWHAFEAHMKPVWSKIGKLDNEKRFLMTPVFETEKDTIGTPMPMAAWKENVLDGGFIDYDGYGYYSKDGVASNVKIIPSDLTTHCRVRTDFDEVIWYNR